MPFSFILKRERRECGKGGKDDYPNFSLSLYPLLLPFFPSLSWAHFWVFQQVLVQPLLFLECSGYAWGSQSETETKETCSPARQVCVGRGGLYVHVYMCVWECARNVCVHTCVSVWVAEWGKWKCMCVLVCVHPCMCMCESRACMCVFVCLTVVCILKGRWEHIHAT